MKQSIIKQFAEHFLSRTIVLAFRSLRKEVKLAFAVTFGSLLLIELIFKNYHSPNLTFFRAGEFYLKVCYSIVASTIFFYLNQQLPKQEKKERAYRHVSSSATQIQIIISGIVKCLNIPGDNNGHSTRFVEIQNAAKQILRSNKVFPPQDIKILYADWHEFLETKTKALNEIIDSMLPLHDVIDSEFFGILTNIKSIIRNNLSLDRNINWQDHSVAVFTFLIFDLSVQRSKIGGSLRNNERLYRKLIRNSAKENTKKGYLNGMN